MNFRVRLLPITMAFIVLVIGSKVLDVLRSGEKLADSSFFANVMAQDEETPEEEAPAEEEEGESKEEGEGEEKAEEEKPADGDEAAEGDENAESLPEESLPPVSNPAGGVLNEAPKVEEGGGSGLAPQATYFSPVELEILQTLSKRREQLELWEKEIKIKENLLASVEKRIDEKALEITALKQEMEAIITAYKNEEDAKIRSLVRIYESMKPRDAARIFDEVEMPILLLVIDKMSERKAAPILAAMDPKKAKQLTVELAEQRREQQGLVDSAREAVRP